jgi:hypothetical protein
MFELKQWMCMQTCNFIVEKFKNLRFVSLWFYTTENDLMHIIEEPQTQRWIKSFKDIAVSERFELWIGPYHHPDEDYFATERWTKAEVKWAKEEFQGKLTSLLMPWNLKSGPLKYDEDDLGLELLFGDSQ